MLLSSRHAARTREARRLPAGGAPGLLAGAGRLISVVRRLIGTARAVLLGILATIGDTQRVRASQIPVYRPPASRDEVVTWVPERSEVRVEWRGGSPPFTVVRADAEDFLRATDIQYVVIDTKRRTVRDAITGGGRTRYWYRVYDRKVDPEVFAFEPEVPTSGQELKIIGVGFDRTCSSNLVGVAGGPDYEVLVCSFTHLRVRVPPMALSGTFWVRTSHGSGGIGMSDRVQSFTWK